MVPLWMFLIVDIMLLVVSVVLVLMSIGVIASAVLH